MALSAGTISLAVKPDTAGFGASLKSGIGKGANGVGAHLGGLIKDGLKSMAGPIAAVTASFAVGHLIQDSVKQFEELAGSVKKMQRITGGTAESVSGMRGAMQLAGVDVNNIDGAVTIFSKNLGKAATNAQKTADMNRLFGQSIKDAHGNVKPMADLLPGLADTFAKMPDGAQKTALATQLFGRSGAQMIPALNKGSAGIAELTQKAKDMGLTLDDVSMKSFAESKKSARDFAGAIQGLKVTLGGDLLPVIDAVQNVFRNALTPAITTVTKFLGEHRDTFLKVGDAISNFGKGAMSSLAPFFKSVGDSFKQLGPVFSALAPQVMTLMSAFSPVSLIFKALQPVLPGIIQLISDLAVSLGGTLSGVLKEILPPITSVVQILIGSMTGILQMLMPVIIQLAKSLGSFLGDAIKMLAPVVVTLVKAIAELLPPLMPVITAVLALAVTAIVPLIKAILPLVMSILPILIDLFNMVMPVVMVIAKVLIAILVPAIQIAIGIIKVIINVVTSVIGFFTGLFKAVHTIGDAFGKVFGAIGGVVKGAFNGVVAFIKGVINTIIGLVNGVIDGINGAAGLVKNLTGGAVNVHLDHIPTLAKGGIVPPTPGGRTVTVAEAGQAEAIIPLSKLKDMVGSGKQTVINYHAAPNDSISAEQKLVDAVRRAKVLAWS